MVRKIRIRIFPDHANLLLQFVELASEEGWPERWERLRQMARRLARRVQKTYISILSQAEELQGHGLLNLSRFSLSEESTPEESEPFVAIELNVDLVHFLDQIWGHEALELLLWLVQSLESLDGFEIRVWLGRHRSSVATVLQELQTVYDSLKDMDSPGGRGNPSQQARTRRHTAPAFEQENTDASSTEAGETGRKRKRRKSSAREVDGEEFSEAAQFFLQYTLLVWPCSEQELGKAWRHALHNSHPDKFPDDPNAKNRTQLLNLGYKELKAALRLV